ncbi:MAG: RES family NAD+ phosphorylase [Bacteroidota bacterium]|nr:RES family NAD+ phosphorylase [Bacteroidota bacterium]MDQ6889339.1 RES family NAD+ phosphorylase [Bacteroidota bacterium]
MIVYRVLHNSVKNLLIGSGNEGRWCGKGRKVIYTSSSVALACLENILRRSGSGFSFDFRTVFYKIPDKIIATKSRLNLLIQNGGCAIIMITAREWEIIS